MSHYDEALLASAPEATRIEKQEGYNVDLLDNPPPRAVSPLPPTTSTAGPSDPSHAEAGLGSKEELDQYMKKTLPWWRTKKWLAIFAVVAIVAIAAIVGGAVGGSANKKNKDDGHNDIPQGATPLESHSGSGSASSTAISTASGSGVSASSPALVTGGSGEETAGPQREVASTTTTSSLPASSTPPVLGIEMGPVAAVDQDSDFVWF